VKFFGKKSVSISEESQYLKVISKGNRSDFVGLINNASKIHAYIQKSSKRLILLDFTNTHFFIPNNEAYNLVKVFELKLTTFKEVKMAAIVNPQSEEIAYFWSAICQNRNIDYKIFRDEAEAVEWLLA